jgi:hypothetical protein
MCTTGEQAGPDTVSKADPGPEGAAIHRVLTTPNAFLAMIAFEPPQQGLIKVDGTFA